MQKPVRSQKLYVRVALAILDSNNKLLVLSEPSNDQYRCSLLPGGTVRREETPLAAIRRIARDKLGLEITRIEQVVKINGKNNGIYHVRYLFLSALPDVLGKVSIGTEKLAETRNIEELLTSGDFLGDHKRLVSAALKKDA